MDVVSISEQTGWVRPHPSSICQDLTILLTIDQFNYDLTDPDFLTYFITRTGQRIDVCDCGWDHVGGVLANPTDYPAGEWTIPDHWLVTRGKLQDCWELYVQGL